MGAVPDERRTDHAGREGSLEAPTRHPVAWRDPEFYDEQSLFKELERVFDICHGCRRCFSLCNAFPHAVRRDRRNRRPASCDERRPKVYWEVVDHCYLCDMCYMTKCPYVPPHPWNVDFPHLMLRAKAVRFQHRAVARARPDAERHRSRSARIAGIPVVAQIVNAVNGTSGRTQAARQGARRAPAGAGAEVSQPRTGAATRRAQRATGRRSTSCRRRTRAARVVLFTTCYGNRNEPDLAEDLAAVLRAQRHRGRRSRSVSSAAACRSSSSATSNRSTQLEGHQRPGARGAGRRGLGHRRADAVLRADVQAGTAVAVSRTTRRWPRSATRCSIRSST